MSWNKRVLRKSKKSRTMHSSSRWQIISWKSPSGSTWRLPSGTTTISTEHRSSSMLTNLAKVFLWTHPLPPLPPLPPPPSSSHLRRQPLFHVRSRLQIQTPHYSHPCLRQHLHKQQLVSLLVVQCAFAKLRLLSQQWPMRVLVQRRPRRKRKKKTKVRQARTK